MQAGVVGMLCTNSRCHWHEVMCGVQCIHQLRAFGLHSWEMPFMIHWLYWQHVDRYFACGQAGR